MSHSVTGRLSKAANVFQAGESTGFAIQLGVKYFDHESKTEKYTNYDAVLFVQNKSQGQLDYYRNSLVEGAIVEVCGTKQAIKQFQGANGLRLSIEILEAKLGFVGMGAPSNKQQANNQPQNNQQQYNQAPAHNQQQYNQAPAQNQQQQFNHPPQHNQQQNYNQQNSQGYRGGFSNQ